MDTKEKREVIATLLRANQPDLAMWAGHNLRVTAAMKPEAREAALRKIVQDKQYAKLDGQVVDMFTASMLVKVIDGLNEKNRAKFIGLPVDKMAHIGWQLVK